MERLSFDPEKCYFYNACDPHIEHKLPQYKCTKGFGSDNRCGCGSGMSTVSMGHPTLRFPVTYPPQTTMSSQTHWIESPALRRYTCAHANMSSTFQENMQRDAALAWQYYSSDDGALSIFPGVSFAVFHADHNDGTCRDYDLQNQCVDFDPRFRSWYTNTIQDRKMLVVVVDTSPSMAQIAEGASNVESDYTIMDIARMIMEDLQRSLTTLDLVGIVSMHNNGLAVCQFAGGGRLTHGRSEELSKCIEDTFVARQNNPGSGGKSGVDYNAALERALEVVKETSRENYCQSSILMISASSATKMPALDDTSWKEQFNSTHIITVGFNHKQQNALSSISCHNGVYINVDTTKAIVVGKDQSAAIRDVNLRSNLRNRMSPFFRFFAYSSVANSGSIGSEKHIEAMRDRVAWVDIYMDALGLGEMTTASLACYSTNSGQLLGVAGIDMPISQLKRYGEGYREKLRELVDMNKRCRLSHVDESSINTIRGGACNYCLRSQCFINSAFLITFPLAAVVIVVLIVFIGGALIAAIFRQRDKLVQNRKSIELKDSVIGKGEEDEDEDYNEGDAPIMESESSIAAASITDSPTECYYKLDQ